MSRRNEMTPEQAIANLVNVRNSFVKFNEVLDSGPPKIIEMSDEAARLKTMLDNMEGMKGGAGTATTELLQSSAAAAAERLGASYKDVTKQVVTLGTTMQETFSSKEEVLAFTELMNEMAAIGGNTGAEQANVVNGVIGQMQAGPIDAGGFSEMAAGAPMMREVIESYMINAGTQGTFDEWLAQGMITADVLKNAMFSSSEEIEARFAAVPVTWGQVWTTTVNELMGTIQPLLELINLLAQHWSTLEPIVVGAAAAIGAVAIAVKGWTVVMSIATLAQKLWNVTTQNMPLMWIATLIGIVVALIYNWVNSVGGLGVAWLIVQDKVITAVDTIKNGVKNIFYSVVLGLTGIVSGVLTTAEDMVNGVIDLLNAVIVKFSDFLGKDVEAIDHVTFGTDFSNWREDYLAEEWDKIEASQKEAEAAHIVRKTDIAREQLAAQNKTTENAAQIPDITAFAQQNQENARNISDNTSKELKNVALHNKIAKEP